ncbi:hypothetical protein F9C07_1523 [Aspergillus flavus]|uniref:Uncharacterized protein n=3 Tax=Aspergillus subgen. Circumdati TaxID=2720871 RepID=A0A7G5JPM4_ASPFN|nr:unnamed protein product [Aspergillus oryzae RIB40]XP_041140484.1 uncharacterized protein G4B84_000726 [Aspergillus flavus NRRL3357]KAJ1713167.1 hypothetical protein NYO67_4668 [Aspergillus flavus]OOO12382.1 hypothetical protein OAory_01001310 [Aspergillus oryzae]KAF7628995.1 hypothetical protein AFLA_004337 [Aspergillus flavus NRRL3357]QMW25481.1 hypothetical protein G4B84_000726 [Aspergillus flavus NRRL3357]QMW37566.1 hypothetical protein G4B11_000802 [Aspergillus flavus]
MAPIRRYLRISKYTILECRIYLENPSDTRWLLDSRDPVLPRIFGAIRPLVLPKLREENERLFARKKGKPVKDVIAEEDFEVSLFLRESRTRHSLLTRHKEFDEPDNASSRKEGAQNPPRPAESSSGVADAGILVESDSESNIDLRDIPQATAEENDKKGKRHRDADEAVDTTANSRASKRRKDEEPDDKKLRFRMNYEGFNIYGWTLCLLVTRKGDKVRANTGSSEPTRQALMEEWMSTQAQGDVDEEQDVS